MQIGKNSQRTVRLGNFEGILGGSGAKVLVGDELVVVVVQRYFLDHFHDGCLVQLVEVGEALIF